MSNEENGIDYIVKKGKEKIQVSGCKEINGDRRDACPTVLGGVSVMSVLR